MVALYQVSAEELCLDSPSLSHRLLPPEYWMKASPATSRRQEGDPCYTGSTRSTLSVGSLSCLGISSVSEARHGSGGVGLSSISSPAAGISLPSWWWSRELQQSSGRVDLALFNYYFFTVSYYLTGCHFFLRNTNKERKLHYFSAVYKAIKLG